MSAYLRRRGVVPSLGSEHRLGTRKFCAACSIGWPHRLPGRAVTRWIGLECLLGWPVANDFFGRSTWSLFDWLVAAPRSARSTTSWWPTRANVATVATSSAWGSTTRWPQVPNRSEEHTSEL